MLVPSGRVASSPPSTDPTDPTDLTARADRTGQSAPLERRRGFSVRDQLRLLVPLVAVWAAGFSVLAIVALQNDVGELLLDPAWVGGAAWYAGLVSQLGAVAWCVAAASAGWSSWIASYGRRQDAATFLRRGAIVTTVLLADDLFSFHAGILEQIGLPKVVGELLVLSPLAAWLLVHARDVLRTRWQLLAASLVAQGTSFLVDLAVHPGRHDFAVLFEDGPKFLGVLAWSTYFVVTARDIARSVLRGELAAAPASIGAEADAYLRTGLVAAESGKAESSAR